MLVKLTTVCPYFIEKAYPSVPLKEWWLTEMVAFNFLQAVNITFKALQMESGVISKKYDNLYALLNQMQMQCTATRVEERSLDLSLVFASDIYMGQFLLTVNGINQLFNGIGVDASEILAQLTDVHQKNRVLLVRSVIYLEAMNGVIVVLSGRQAAGCKSPSVTPCLPMDLIGTSVVDFVALVSIYKTQLRDAFKPKVMQKICQQHKYLVRIAAQDPPMRSQLQAKTRSVFSKSWSLCGSRFHELQMFAAGLTTVTPTTSCVEGEFSLMSYRCNSQCSGLTDFSLEGVMYAKQYKALHKVKAYI